MTTKHTILIQSNGKVVITSLGRETKGLKPLGAKCTVITSVEFSVGGSNMRMKVMFMSNATTTIEVTRRSIHLPDEGLYGLYQ